MPFRIDDARCAAPNTLDKDFACIGEEKLAVVNKPNWWGHFCCLTFDVRGGPPAGRPLDGGVRPKAAIGTDTGLGILTRQPNECDIETAGGHGSMAKEMTTCFGVCLNSAMMACLDLAAISPKDELVGIP